MKIIFFFTSILTVHISSGQVCNVDFTYTIGNNNVVTFTGNSTTSSCPQWGGCCLYLDCGDPNSGQFNFSDPFIHTFNDIRHFYKEPGTYSLCVTLNHSITPLCSCHDSSCQQVTITDTGSYCQASYCYVAVSDTNGVLDVNFINTSASEDSITNIEWRFNDGLESFQYNAHHYFGLPPTTLGTYGVHLFIQTAGGCQSVYFDTIVEGTSCATTPISGAIFTETGLPVPGATITLSGYDIQTAITDTSGHYSFMVAQGGNYTITPEKNNDVVTNNGITSIDVLLTRRHILGMPFSSPYKIVAADVDSSNSVSTLDILLMRSIILQNINAFPNGRLWSFVPSDHVFTDLLNPFPYPVSRSYTNLSSPLTNQDFIGIKLGDVNDSWDMNIP